MTMTHPVLTTLIALLWIAAPNTIADDDARLHTLQQTMNTIQTTLTDQQKQLTTLYGEVKKQLRDAVAIHRYIQTTLKHALTYEQGNDTFTANVHQEFSAINHRIASIHAALLVTNEHVQTANDELHTIADTVSSPKMHEIECRKLLFRDGKIYRTAAALTSGGYMIDGVFPVSIEPVNLPTISITDNGTILVYNGTRYPLATLNNRLLLD